jgi:hypothetical protein
MANIVISGIHRRIVSCPLSLSFKIKAGKKKKLFIYLFIFFIFTFSIKKERKRKKGRNIFCFHFCLVESFERHHGYNKYKCVGRKRN